MAFDTALVRLVETGLACAGAGLYGFSAFQQESGGSSGLLHFLISRPGTAGVAGLVQEYARDISIFFRAQPERVEHHARALAGILRNYGPLPEEFAKAMATDDATAAGSIPRMLAIGVVRRSAAADALKPEKLDEGLSQRLLEPLFERLLMDRALLTSLGDALGEFAVEHAPDPAPDLTQNYSRTAALPWTVSSSPPAQKVAELSSAAGLSASVIKSMLEGLDARWINVPALTDWLRSHRALFKSLEDGLAKGGHGDPAILTLRLQAAHALAAGRFEVSDQILGQAERIDATAAQQEEGRTRVRLISAADSRAARGRIAHLRFRYREAAAHYDAAADITPASEAREKWKHLMRKAEVLALQAERFRDDAALQEAIGLHRQCLELRPLNIASKDWAITECLFGRLIGQLGAVKQSPQLLRQASEVCGRAADELVGRREPQLWAEAVTCRADALVRLARLSNNAATWREANSAYRESLAVFTRQSAEVEWATAQIGIAKCMMGLAGEVAPAPRYADAIASFRQALEVLKQDRSPAQWLEAKTGLGLALLMFSECTGHQQAADEAMSILDDIDGKLDRASQPELWAPVRGGLGRLKLAQARKAPSPELLDGAIAALESALHVSTKSRDPISFRRLQRDIGSAYELLGAHSPAGAVHHLEAAVASYRAALETVDRSRADEDWAGLELDLGRSLFHLGSLTRSERHIAEALVCDQAALEKFQELGLSDSANSARDGLDEKSRVAEKLRGSAKPGSSPLSHEPNRSAGSRFRPADLSE